MHAIRWSVANGRARHSRIIRHLVNNANYYTATNFKLQMLEQIDNHSDWFVNELTTICSFADAFVAINFQIALYNALIDTK